MVLNRVLYSTAALLFIELSRSQCDTVFPDYQITYISSNPLSSDVYYLGDRRDNSISSAIECKRYCQDLNYLCDAANKHSDTQLEGSSLFLDEPDRCRLIIEHNPDSDDDQHGAWALLTPDIVASEYIVELQFQFRDPGTDGYAAGGLVFAASPWSSSASTGALISISIETRTDMIWMYKLTFSPGSWRWEIVASESLTESIDLGEVYTLKVHKLSDGHWDVYLDDELVWYSTSTDEKITSSEFPHNYAGVYSWQSRIRANQLAVSFPSVAADEMVCSGYMFNNHTSECFGYYGAQYEELYASLSLNSAYDSGVISPTCRPTESPVTSIIPTATTTTKSPTSKSPTLNSAITKAPTTATTSITALTNMPTQSPTTIEDAPNSTLTFQSSIQPTLTPIVLQHTSQTQPQPSQSPIIDMGSVAVYFYSNITSSAMDVGSKCSPWLISIDVLQNSSLNITDAGIHMHPSMVVNNTDINRVAECFFWNHSTADSPSWSVDTCFLFNQSNHSLSCACQNSAPLTPHDDHGMEFVPGFAAMIFNANSLTLQNVIDFPVVWVCILAVAILLCLSYCVYPRKRENRSILAYEDIIFEHFKNEKLQKDMIGKQIEFLSLYLPNTKFLGAGLRSMCAGRRAKFMFCRLHYHLFKIFLRNEHMLLSAFQRTAGTNFSARQRLSCFFMYICCIINGNAMFYGSGRDLYSNKLSEILLAFAESLTISLCGTVPVLLVRTIFLKSKPMTVTRTIEFHDHDKFLQLNRTRETSAVSGISDGTTTSHGPRFLQLKPPVKMKSVAPEFPRYESYLARIATIKEKRQNTRHSTLKLAAQAAKNAHSKAYKMKLVEDVRVVLFNAVYPLPRKCKRFAWLLLVSWTLLMIALAIMYGICFDSGFERFVRELKKQHGDCHAGFVEFKANFAADLETGVTGQYDQDDDGGFAVLDDLILTESTRWLASLCLSLLASLLIWQPLGQCCLTWIRIWMFTWNLRMALTPPNFYKLFKKCCGCVHGRGAEWESHRILDVSRGDEQPPSRYAMIANADRPLDTIGFFSNDELFLKVNEEEITQKKDSDLLELTHFNIGKNVGRFKPLTPAEIKQHLDAIDSDSEEEDSEEHAEFGHHPDAYANNNHHMLPTITEIEQENEDEEYEYYFE